MLADLVAAFKQIGTSITQNLSFLLIFIAILWTIQIINIALKYRLNILGIYPRTWHGLIGIVISPFLHANNQHLFFNSIPLFVLSALVLASGKVLFFQISAVIIILSGIALWLFGRPAFHVGASNLVMGYWGFLLTNAYLQQSVMTALLAFLCLFYFGGLIFSLFPTEEKVSWEGHIFGFLSGVFTSYALL